MDIVIDADGTCWTHDYPRMGKDIGAIPVLKKLIENGHNLILFTMRDKKELRDAVDWFTVNGILLYGIQVNPTQGHWTTSPKALGELIIDDAALGAPLKLDLEFHNRAFIDWVKVEHMLIMMGLIKWKYIAGKDIGII